MPAFRKALLLFNPVAGSNPRGYLALVEELTSTLRRAGVEVKSEATAGAGMAGEQSRCAMDAGCDAVLICGGDGTVFDALQGLAGNGNHTALGVIPLGTGNVLAHNLGLAQAPAKALRRLLEYRPQTIPVGRIECAGRGFYFTVAAGVGAHAELIYHTGTAAKQRGGKLAYYMHGTRILLSQSFAPFPVEITRTNGELLRTSVQDVVAMRVPSFGGPLSRWRPGISLLRPELRLILLPRAASARLLAYGLRAMAGGVDCEESAEMERPDSPLKFLSASRVVCHAPQANSQQVRLQADGEMLAGVACLQNDTSPENQTVISVVPRALSLLLPPS